MPNWTTNTVTIEAPAGVLAKMYAECFTEGVLDFEKIVPKPDGFDASLPSGSGGESYDLYYGDVGAWRKYAMYPWMQKAGGVDRDSVIRVFAERYEQNKFVLGQRETYPTYKDLADAYKHNVDVSGCKTWYEWNTAHWGTKWGACDASPIEPLDENDTIVEFKFDTAWGEPAPIFEALSQRYPTAHLRVVCDHDGDSEITGRHYGPIEY